MTRMHLMWFCAFSPHAGFGLDGWAGPRTTGYEWTRPELWQDMAMALERAKFDLIMLGDSLAVPGTYQGRMDAYLRYAEHAPFHDPGPLVAIMLPPSILPSPLRSHSLASPPHDGHTPRRGRCVEARSIRGRYRRGRAKAPGWRISRSAWRRRSRARPRP